MFQDHLPHYEVRRADNGFLWCRVYHFSSAIDIAKGLSQLEPYARLVIEVRRINPGIGPIVALTFVNGVASDRK